MLRCTVTRTRRPLGFRLRRLVRIAWLRFEIHSDEEWIASCTRDGIFEGLQLRYIRDRVAELRVALALEQAS